MFEAANYFLPFKIELEVECGEESCISVVFILIHREAFRNTSSVSDALKPHH